MTRRMFAVRMAAGGAGAALRGITLAASGDAVLSFDSESIHRETAIAASPAKIYTALTDARQFTRLMALSGMRGRAEIGPGEGAPFSLFGGAIVGRNVELVPGHRIVQAWRETTWDPGVYSLVTFNLRAQPGGTLIVFDHTGFPRGAGAHLTVGWGEHYWDPLKKLLGQS